MARDGPTGDVADMSVVDLTRSSALSCAERDPAHVLYDHASEVLFAAQGLRAAAGLEGAEPAIAATFGCLESSVDALAQAIETLTRSAVAQVDADDEAGMRLALQGQDAAHVLRVARDVLATIRDRVGAIAAEGDE
jgi:hypothetical protein